MKFKIIKVYLMRKGNPVSVIDGYDMKVKGNWPSVREAAEDLGIPANSIYSSIFNRTLVYEAYFVYTADIATFRPKPRVSRRLKGLKQCEKLRKLLSQG